jgi:hypothetical protein
LLSFANLARDQQLLFAAREDAASILQTDPELEKEEHKGLREIFQSAWNGKRSLAEIA